MKGVISDFDGILVETENAKAIGWYAAVKRIKGEITDEDIKDIKDRNDHGRELAESIVQELKTKKNSYLPQNEDDMKRLVGDKIPAVGLAGVSALSGKSDMELAVWCAGGETKDFRNNIWDVFLANSPQFRDLNPEKRAEKLKALEGYRTELKPPFMILGAEPIEGNQRFFGALLDSGFGGRLALVNQSKSSDMNDLFVYNRLWAIESRLPNAFGTYEKERGFDLAFCVGDYGKKSGAPKDKVEAYENACSRVGVKPAETMTFEDTEGGVKAAVKAGIGVIVGFRLIGRLQNLSDAHYIVEEGLEKMSSVVRGLSDKDLNQVRKELDKLAADGKIVKNIKPVEELTPPSTETLPRKDVRRN